jgi:hypothetical protein
MESRPFKAEAMGIICSMTSKQCFIPAFYPWKMEGSKRKFRASSQGNSDLKRKQSVTLDSNAAQTSHLLSNQCIENLDEGIQQNDHMFFTGHSGRKTGNTNTTELHDLNKSKAYL